jgi:sugar phosphate isomerase/epimerase
MPKPLAVQLYTFRDPARFGGAGMGLDPQTLEAIAAIGYLGVETVDVPGGDPVAARRVLDGLGLQVASSHTWGSIDDLDGFARSAAAVAELGASTIIVSGKGFETVEAVDAFTDRLNGAARVATKAGVRLGYHNHDAEMHPVDGIPAYRRMIDRLDPTVVLQVDIFWVVVGGAVPTDVIAESGDRVVSLHIKDGVTLPSAAAGAEPFVNVPIGRGVIDVATAIGAADLMSQIEWLIVEFDYCDGSPVEAVRASYQDLVGRALGRGSVG